MASVQYLREFINERLTAAAEQIFLEFEKTIVQYEEEMERQRRLLDITWKPQIKLHRTDLPLRLLCREEEVLPEQQLWNQERSSSVDQEEPEPPQIKEEEEELCSSQEGEQLGLEEETDTFMVTAAYKESDLSNATHSDSSVFVGTESREAFKVLNNSTQIKKDIDHQPRELDVTSSAETDVHRTDLAQQHVCKEEVLPEQQLCNQERSSSLDREEPEPPQSTEEPEPPQSTEEPEPPQIKEEQQELRSSQEDEQVVLKLTQMIGKNVKLYDMVLQFLRTLFLRTRNVHYCTLRAELLMSLHDLDISEICSVDPCHKFTWCLDACIREKFVDGKRARELQGFLDGVKKGQEQVLGDLSMILCDPFACNTLVLSIMRNLQELLSQDALPRDSPDLMLLLRMLSLGQGAWDMIDSQVFKEPRLDLEVVTRFLPAMMSVVVDDHTFTVEQKLPSEEKSSLSYPTTLPESFNRYLQENRVACEMGLYYVLHIAKLRNKNALQRLLPALVETYNDMAFGDIFLHLLTGHLTLLSDEFGSEEFCSVVFDGFLLTSFSSKENVHRHTLRMLLHLHHKVLPSYMETLMKTLEPPKQCSEPLKELYNQLTEKMEAQKKSPPPTDETPSLDLGLHPVTVPTTASTPTTPL